jgi:hypothetical protein
VLYSTVPNDVVVGALRDVRADVAHFI